MPSSRRIEIESHAWRAFTNAGKPVLELKYTNETRTGRKDSLTWGDTNLTGLPTLPANNATRKIIPAYLELDERHQLLEGSIRQHGQMQVTTDSTARFDSMNAKVI